MVLSHVAERILLTGVLLPQAVARQHRSDPSSTREPGDSEKSCLTRKCRGKLSVEAHSLVNLRAACPKVKIQSQDQDFHEWVNRLQGPWVC